MESNDTMKFIKFAVCPECSEETQPNISNDIIYTDYSNPLYLNFYATCCTCGYQTKRYNHVIDLVKDWNSASFKNWPFEDNKIEERSTNES